MGKGGKKYAMKEIEETRAAGKDDAFEEILDRVEEAGGKIDRDETAPLYMDVGAQELETGSQRIVEFNLNKFDFQLTRTVETHSMQGEGHQKHVEPLKAPRSNIKMKRKEEMSDDWLVMDLEDMF